MNEPELKVSISFLRCRKIENLSPLWIPVEIIVSSLQNSETGLDHLTLGISLLVASLPVHHGLPGLTSPPVVITLLLRCHRAISSQSDFGIWL